ncbi:MAG TPA: diheme cytochrome c-553 [Bacteroidota bacterium]|nr:diheme cytochrome c-553 [Bacteroidota bacterium]
MKGSSMVVAVGLCCALSVSAGLAQKKDPKIQAMIARGKYLVTLGSCNDCHSPKKMTPQGPVVDESSLLSGSPAGEPVPAVPPGVLGPDKWGALTTNDQTIWVGPWGTSFTRNLTPDKETGLGSWTEAMFIKALRTGKDMGEGRPILPPMPWEMIGKATDSDLKAIFAYLQSLKPIKNAIHDPIPPAGAPPAGH